MFNEFVKNNIILTSIVIFLFVYAITISVKPQFIFNKDGSVKNFGLGYNNKTVIPLWLIVIIFSIIIYFILIYLF